MTARRRILFIALACAMLLGAGGLAVRLAGPGSDVAAPPLPPPRIVARGWVEPRDRVHRVSGPPSGGTVARLNVREGDHVHAGDILAVLDHHDLESASVDAAQADLIRAERDRAQVASGAKSSQIAAQEALVSLRSAELARSVQQVQRNETLVSRGMLSVDSRDAQRLEHQRATEALRQARAELAELREVRPVDLAVADAHVGQVRARLALAQVARERALIRAPIDGVVLNVTARLGAALGLEGLLTLADMDKLIVLAAFEERDAPRVRAGSIVDVTQAGSGPRWQGKVVRLRHQVYRQTDPTADVLRGRDARVVEAEIEVEPVDGAGLPPFVGTELEVTVRPDTPTPTPHPAAPTS